LYLKPRGEMTRVLGRGLENENRDEDVSLLCCGNQRAKSKVQEAAGRLHLREKLRLVTSLRQG
jgi:hypothetical protein